MCIIDDAQQLSLFQVSAVAWHVPFLLLLFDNQQTIDLNPQNHTAGKTHCDSGRYYSWTRCIHGQTVMYPWMCIPKTNIIQLSFSKRCGIDACQLLRETNDNILDGKRNRRSKGIWSPAEKPGLFTKDELQSLPDTRLRYVFVHRDIFHACSEPGVLEPGCMRIASGDDKNDSSIPRVAIGKTIFWNMIHEGLTFLSVYLSGDLVSLVERYRLPFLDSEFAILTMFYCADQVFFFSDMVLAALQDLSIRKAYGLPSDKDLLHLWRVGKPDDFVGATALLSQTGILPRTIRGANLHALARDPGRYQVSNTRASFLSSCFYAWECLQEPSPSTWKNLKRVLLHDGGKLRREPILQNVYVAEGQSFASCDNYQHLFFDEQKAFIALMHKLNNMISLYSV